MLNKVILMGRLTAHPELKKTPSGISVTSFSLAVQRQYVNGNGERETDYIDCVAWRGTAEFVCKYFAKGQLVAVCGSLETRNWQDKNGNNRKMVEVSVKEVDFAEPKRQMRQQYEAPVNITPDDFDEVDIDDNLPF